MEKKEWQPIWIAKANLAELALPGQYWTKEGKREKEKKKLQTQKQIQGHTVWTESYCEFSKIYFVVN